MQRWQDEFSKHPIHATLKILRENVEAEQVIVDTTREAERTRLLKVIGVMERAIADLDPDLVPIDILGALNNQISQSGTINSIRNFATNGNFSHLQEANSQISPALGYIYQLSSLRSGKGQRQSDLEAATTSFERFSKAINNKLTELEGNASKSGLAIEQAAANIRDMQAAYTALSGQFKEKIVEWNNQTSELISAHKTSLTAALSQCRIEFNELTSIIRNEAADKIRQLLEREESQAEANRKTISEKLQDIQSDSESKHAEILKFYGLVTHDSVTGGHKRIADREHDAANFWRKFTVGCIVVTIVWISYSIFCLSPDLAPSKLFWLQIGKSAALTMLLVSFAIYSSRQSNLHRRNEQKARSFFLKVQAFDPFVANLPDEQRWNMKEAMTHRIFGPDETDSAKSSASSDDFKGMEQVVTLMEKLRALWNR